jgi:hypothetical protein
MRIEEVFWGTGIGQVADIKTITTVANNDNQFIFCQPEADLDWLGNIKLIAMLDGVDDGLADCKSNPVCIFGLKASKLCQLVSNGANHFDESVVTCNGNFNDRFSCARNVI